MRESDIYFNDNYFIESIDPSYYVFLDDNEKTFAISLKLRQVNFPATTGFLLKPGNEDILKNLFGCKSLEELVGKKVTKIIDYKTMRYAIGCDGRYLTNYDIYSDSIGNSQKLLTEQELRKYMEFGVNYETSYKKR